MGAVRRCVEEREDLPQEAGSSERSPQSSSRSQVQEMGMQRPLAHGYWLGGHVRAGERVQVARLEGFGVKL